MVSKSANCEPCDNPKYPTEKFNFVTTEESQTVEEINTESQSVEEPATEKDMTIVTEATWEERAQSETPVREVIRGTDKNFRGTDGVGTDHTTRAPISTQANEVTAENERSTTTTPMPTEVETTEPEVVVTTEVKTIPSEASEVTVTEAYNVTERVTNRFTRSTEAASTDDDEIFVTTEATTSETLQQDATEGVSTEITKKVVTEHFTSYGIESTDEVTTQAEEVTSMETESPEVSVQEVTDVRTTAGVTTSARITTEDRVETTEVYITEVTEVTVKDTSEPASTINRETTTSPRYEDQDYTTSRDTLVSTELSTVNQNVTGSREETSEGFTTSQGQDEEQTTSLEGIDPTNKHSGHLSVVSTEAEAVRVVSTEAVRPSTEANTKRATGPEAGRRSTESAADSTEAATEGRRDSTVMVTYRTEYRTEVTAAREEAATSEQQQESTTKETFMIPTGFLNEKSRAPLRTEEPTVAATKKRETKPFSLISDDSTSSEPRIGTTTEFTTESLFGE